MVEADVGDDADRGAQDRVLAESLVLGFDGHTLKHRGVGALGHPLLEDVVLLVDVGRADALDRVLGALVVDDAGVGSRGFGDGGESLCAQYSADHAGHGGFAADPVDVNIDIESVQGCGIADFAATKTLHGEGGRDAGGGQKVSMK